MPPSFSIQKDAAKELNFAQKQERVVNNLTAFVQMPYSQAIVSQKSMFKAIWFNPLGLTPQQVADALKEKAGQVFRLQEGFAKFVNTVVPNTVEPNDYLPIKEVTYNKDGSVVVSTEDNKERVKLGLVVKDES